jgi:hypothetical protein
MLARNELSKLNDVNPKQPNDSRLRRSTRFGSVVNRLLGIAELSFLHSR